MKVSIIIPTYNEAANIGGLVKYLWANNDGSLAEIIVSDGGSRDETIAIAQQAGAIVINSPQKGRAVQMNNGARNAAGDIFYFIHADTRPPMGFLRDIKNANRLNFNLGRYKTKFDSDKMILKFNAWFTRLDLFVCMGGDQTLFIERNIFEKCKGFNEDMIIMEDYDLCARARKIGNYKILDGAALVSARKYNANSWLKVQLANAKIVNMYKKGATQSEMANLYKKMLN